MKVAILGGTRGMGRALAQGMAERGDDVAILGRDLDDAKKSAADVAARSPAGAKGFAVHCDLEKPETFRPALDAAESAMGGLDVVVVTAALFATQDAMEADAGLTERVLTVDFAHTVGFCEEARKKLLLRGGGTLCVFSSVAGDRARKTNVLYGAAKAGLSSYLEGLDHRFRAQGLKTVCIKPGFVRTGMTAGLKEPPFSADPDAVVPVVLDAIDKGLPVAYAPPVWQWVMGVVKGLPRFVMRRAGF